MHSDVGKQQNQEADARVGERLGHSFYWSFCKKVQSKKLILTGLNNLVGLGKGSGLVIQYLPQDSC
jgi:hypothetical protein